MDEKAFFEGVGLKIGYKLVVVVVIGLILVKLCRFRE